MTEPLTKVLHPFVPRRLLGQQSPRLDWAFVQFDGYVLFAIFHLPVGLCSQGHPREAQPAPLWQPLEERQVTGSPSCLVEVEVDSRSLGRPRLIAPIHRPHHPRPVRRRSRRLPAIGIPRPSLSTVPPAPSLVMHKDSELPAWSPLACRLFDSCHHHLLLSSYPLVHHHSTRSSHPLPLGLRHHPMAPTPPRRHLAPSPIR